MGPVLAPGAGLGKWLYLDAMSGLSGDMILGALLDLGVPLVVVEHAVASLGFEGFTLHRGRAFRSAIAATTFAVRLTVEHPRRDYQSIDKMLFDSPLEAPVKTLARRIFRTLAEAEARVHRMPIERVHFHEVGAVDAIVDIVGAAAAFTYLGAEVVCSPLPMGHGFIRAEHGPLPNPPPAVVHALAGVPTYAVDVPFELVTPTGASIVATVASSFVRWPTMSPLSVGYGAGRRELRDRPNVLRVVLAERVPLAAPTHVVLSTNLDDVPGEVLAYVTQALGRAGALDVWTTPISMKKGRPAVMLSALATVETEPTLTALILRETRSLGVRRELVTRVERPRRLAEIDTRFGKVPIKIAEGPYGPPTWKPEFDACEAIAKAHGIPLHEVLAEIALADPFEAPTP